MNKMSRAAFTLMEMIVVVAVMAILLTAATPSLFQLSKQRDTQKEELSLQAIREALQAHLAEKNKVPVLATWYDDLAPYSRLSAEDIQYDTWGKERAYVVYTDTTRKLKGHHVDVNYVTVSSAGPDRLPAESITGLPITGDKENFAVRSDLAWWANTASQQVTLFGTLEAKQDDQLLKFTDYADKIAMVDETIGRLEKVTEVLEGYGKTRYAEWVQPCMDADVSATIPAYCNSMTGGGVDGGAREKMVYYPKAVAIDAVADTAAYADDFDATIAASTLPVVSGQNNDVTRRTGMENLMRRLGLPTEYCCSAYELGSDDKPKPFYYFSNPRARVGAGCGTRPGADDMKNPVRVTTDYIPDASLNPTCG